MQLYGYQKLGAQFLASRQRALLADGMGLGKSAQAICAARAVNARNLAVVCPAIARPNWVRELQLWNFTGTSLVESYDKVTSRRELQEEIKAMRPDVLVLDESHYLKNRTAKRTKVLYGAQSLGDGIVKHAQRVWMLSGTPVPNNPSELWTMFAANFPDLIPNKLGGERPQNWYEFLSKYCFYTRHPDWGIQVQGCRRPEELGELLNRCWLRRRPEEVNSDLPPITWGTTILDPKKTKELRDYMKSPEYKEIQKVVDAAIEKDGNLAVPYLATIRRLTGLAKVGPAADLIKSELEARDYKKVVLFYQHREVGDQLQYRLGKFGLVRIDGSTQANARQRLIDQFQTDSNCQVFLGQIKTCGTAINLQAASQVVFVENSWSFAENEQAGKRCHRLNSRKPVFVRMLTLAGSIDEAVTKVLARKAQMNSQIEDARSE